MTLIENLHVATDQTNLANMSIFFLLSQFISHGHCFVPHNMLCAVTLLRAPLRHVTVTELSQPGPTCWTRFDTA